MQRYKSPESFRAALEARLATIAADGGIALERLRRRAVFERLLARLEYAAPGSWVVKGGVAMEVRLPDRARRTKDLDLATRASTDTSSIHEQLVEALGQDPFEDYFVFVVSAPKVLALDDAGRPGWKFSVDARLAERTFAPVTMDVVERSEEITETARVTYPTLVGFAALPPVVIELVEPTQHFAEKLHAYTREGARVNTRTKDLPDMVLLIEDGLAPDADLYRVADHVFAVRNTHALPDRLESPPAAWNAAFETLVADLDIEPRTLEDAFRVVGDFWAAAVAAAKE